MARIVQAINVVTKVDGKIVDLFKGDELPGSIPAKEVERLDAAGALVPLEDEPAEPVEAPAGFVLASASDEEVAAWVKDSTIEVIETAVGDDSEQAARVLAAEQARGDDTRKTLVEKLEELVTAA